ncbi:MAG: GNAT family N-acetyltransferase [Proteobacteria bacterium]|nr:GNAT family N-acetyltransferase [Pseudomonadota bacterium]
MRDTVENFRIHPAAMRIRPAVPADIPAFFDIRTSVRENEMSLEELASQGVTPQTLPALLDENARAWVAEHDGNVVAFVLASSLEARIVAMFVRPGYERQGLGRQLMHQAEGWLFSQGCEEIWLVTDDDERVRANGFYRHLGWKLDDLLDGPVRFIKRLPGE